MYICKPIEKKLHLQSRRRYLSTNQTYAVIWLHLRFTNVFRKHDTFICCLRVLIFLTTRFSPKCNNTWQIHYTTNNTWQIHYTTNNTRQIHYTTNSVNKSVEGFWTQANYLIGNLNTLELILQNTTLTLISVGQWEHSVWFI